MKYYIGVDLGGMSMKVGIVDEHYRIIATARHETIVEKGGEGIAADMTKTIMEALGKSGLSMDDMEWCGIGSPGAVNRDSGVIEFANNLKFLNVPFRDYMEKNINKKVFMENDANAAAYGEAIAGAGGGCKNLVCITLGTGVGAGVILDGKIFTGSNFAGGELGHTVIVKDGAPCTCGRRGCFESYASASGLIRMTKEAMERHRSSMMWEIAGGLDQVDGRTSFDAMRAGDAAGKAVVDGYLSYLGCGVTNVINTFQPEILCIGGGISKEGDTILQPVRAYVDRESYKTQSPDSRTKIVMARLGNDAGIIGAALAAQSR